MSGKGKNELNYSRIDLTRFAYDVLRYTALKFRVPESSIPVWEGSSNDYGHGDFFSVVCARIMVCQIVFRYKFHQYFSWHHQSNQLASPELIGELLQEVIDEVEKELKLKILVMVEFSLAAVSELFLFLYLKNIDLDPRNLVTLWKQYYFHRNESAFKMEGGLKEVYLYARNQGYDNMYVFINSFIDGHCASYKYTVNIKTLGKAFRDAATEEMNKNKESLSSDEDDIEIEAAKIKDQITTLNIGNAVVVQPPQPDGASGSNETQNTGLNIIPPNKVLKLPSPSATSSQDPSAATPEERLFAPKERKDRINSLLRAIRHRLVQPSSDSSEKKQSNASALKDTTPSYRLLGAIPNTCGGSSSQTDMPSPCPSVEQGPGQPSSDSSEKKQSNVSALKGTTPSYRLFGARPKTYGGSSSQTDMPSPCPSMEQDPGQPSSDSSGTEQSSKKKSDFSVDDEVTSQRHPVASGQETKEEFKESS